MVICTRSSRLYSSRSPRLKITASRSSRCSRKWTTPALEKTPRTMSSRSHRFSVRMYVSTRAPSPRWRSGASDGNKHRRVASASLRRPAVARLCCWRLMGPAMRCWRRSSCHTQAKANRRSDCETQASEAQYVQALHIQPVMQRGLKYRLVMICFH